ncbi:hypothetical protein [Dongshaea marina]|uniref:hypothetical protein n=1 Tax=Dongshaea marina TaxID=2047966 RepID=UPI00131F0066|nr:hypothetical protein [Dongshaea marina]
MGKIDDKQQERQGSKSGEHHNNKAMEKFLRSSVKKRFNFTRMATKIRHPYFHGPTRRAAIDERCEK